MVTAPRTNLSVSQIWLSSRVSKASYTSTCDTGARAHCVEQTTAVTSARAAAKLAAEIRASPRRGCVTLAIMAPISWRRRTPRLGRRLAIRSRNRCPLRSAGPEPRGVSVSGTSYVRLPQLDPIPSPSRLAGSNLEWALRWFDNSLRWNSESLTRARGKAAAFGFSSPWTLPMCGR